MAELIATGESTSLNLTPFDPARFMPERGKRGRKMGSVDVGEQW